MSAIASAIDPIEVAARARRLRLHVLRMAERIGQGYVGQGLGIADLMAVLWFGAMRYDPRRPAWPERDRFVLSIGHYSIGLYAALAEAGVIALDELATYGADGARLEMSGGEEVPGFEMTGGSLGHGLGQALGMALGNRLAGRDARTFCLISDGELQEGSIWEAAMAAAHHRVDRLTLFVDMNRQQADGAPERVMNVEPAPDKFAAFGWHAQRVDGNDVAALIAAIEVARGVRDRPQVIVLDTLMGKGVPIFEAREKNHFIRVAPEEWALAIAHVAGDRP